jgi:hypothetical protein
MVPGMLANKTGNDFYIYLRQSVWKFFSEHFDLKGSQASKERLLGLLHEHGLGDLTGETSRILDACERGSFTGVVPTDDKQKLLEDTRSLMERIERGSHSAYL